MNSDRVPVLTTERLILRGWNAGDFPAYADLLADPASARFIARGGKPYSAAQAWAEMCFFIGHWDMRGFGMFAVEERETGKFVGRIGALQPHGWPGLELAWAVVPDARGRGYAAEGAQTALTWIFDATDTDSVISVIHADNLASQRVAERLGERRTGDSFAPLGEPCEIWRITREAWVPESGPDFSP